MALPSLKRPRSDCAGFTVNDAIYVFGGESLQSQVEEVKQAHESDTESSNSGMTDPVGEKFVVNGNRWKEFDGSSSKMRTNTDILRLLVNGPSALLYE